MHESAQNTAFGGPEGCTKTEARPKNFSPEGLSVNEITKENHAVKRIAVLLCIVFSVFLMHSHCRKDFSPLHLAKNPRELSWSVDTLSHPDNWQASLIDIWASSSEDVYVAGTANTTRGILWHYDGNQWTDIKIHSSQGGSIKGSISFSDIFGFGPDDVWLVGDIVDYNPNPPPDLVHSSLVVHYNGTDWERIPTPEGHALESIWGPYKNNLWMAGVNGTLFHYDGVTIKNDTIPLNIPKDANPVYNVVSITGNESEAYMLLADFNSRPWRYFFLEYQDNQWVVKNSTFFFDSHRLWMSPSGKLYATGRAVYRREGDSWVTLIDGSATGSTYDIYGTSDNDLFIVGKSVNGDGAVHHYNGSDWFFYENLENPNFIYYRVWTDGEEVFVTGRAYPQSIVLHGK